MNGITMGNLMSLFDYGMTCDMGYITVEVSTKGTSGKELIVTPRCNFAAKKEYYASEYTDDLQLKTCRDISIANAYYVKCIGGEKMYDISNINKNYSLPVIKNKVGIAFNVISPTKKADVVEVKGVKSVVHGYSEPEDGVKEAIGKIRENGYDVTIFSSECEDKEKYLKIKQYLEDNNIHYDHLCSFMDIDVDFVVDRYTINPGKDLSLLPDKIMNFKYIHQ